MTGSAVTPERRNGYGRIAVPVAWVSAVAAIVTTLLVLLDKGGRPWGDHGPVMIEGDGDPGPYIFFGTLTLLFLVIATRLWRRDPANSLARWTAVFAFAVSSAVVTDMLSSWMLTFRHVTDAALVLRLLGGVWLGVGWSAMLVMLLRFPTGRRLSRLWRVVEAGGLLGAGLLFLAIFEPGNQDVEPFTSPFVDSPLGAIAELGYFGWTLLSFGTLLAILSIVVRAFRARGDERQQLKWVGFGLVFGWG
ncbi:MAG: hypothetical protein R3249_04220, partial [Nitriliruptorales bacterium]|nr:hypothetical protein [Nitriliruptorales bacterium]